MSDEKISSGESKKAKDSFNFSKEENGVTKSVSGRQVENGWIIDINKSWTEKDNDGNDRYKSDYRTYISKDNPLDKIKEKKNKKEDGDMSEMFDSIMGSNGMLLVN